jgi:hypothetical protein
LASESLFNTAGLVSPGYPLTTTWVIPLDSVEVEVIDIDVDILRQKKAFERIGIMKCGSEEAGSGNINP